jgi:hypothetical protein
MYLVNKEKNFVSSDALNFGQYSSSEPQEHLILENSKTQNCSLPAPGWHCPNLWASSLQ